MIVLRFLLLIISMLIFSGGISSAATGTFYTNSEGYYGQGDSGCDGNPNWWVYESDHFLIYSDISSDYVRVLLAQMAEKEFATLKTAFGVTDTELGIDTNDSSTKPHICSSGVGSVGCGGYRGISMPALDGENMDPVDRLNDYYGYRVWVRHELTHFIQGYLAHDKVNGSDELSGLEKMEIWFLEGQAVLLQRDPLMELMDTLSLTDYYAAGRPNPVSVKTRQAMDDAGLTNPDIYPAFSLAAKYLFDTTARGGAGNSLLTSKNFFRQISGGVSFSEAFAGTFTRAGAPLTVDDFENNFETWMNEYLGNLETPGTVSGGTDISMVAVFPYNTGLDMITGFPGGVSSSGDFTLNVSELKDGTYENALCFVGDDGATIYGPATMTVSNGRLSPTIYDVSQWPQSCATLYPASDGFSATGGSGTLTVASLNCSWTAASNDSWITISSGNSGTESGVVSYSVSANTTGNTRTGTMTIGRETFTVTQTAFNPALYFPHVDASAPWETEIALINTSNQTITGTLRALSNGGQLIETMDVTLFPNGRRQITVAGEFTNHTNIGYIIFDTDSSSVQGYTKFYQEGIYRAAIPAVTTSEINTSSIYIPHIDSDSDWWTGISLVNTTSEEKALMITFSDGRSVSYPLDANAHDAFTIADLFGGVPQPGIKSAVITNAGGVIGLELFGGIGGNNQLDGLLITDDTASVIYYPHVASDTEWWTGIVAYNQSAAEATITITPFTEGGTALSPSTHTLDGKEKYVDLVSNLGLPDGTAWFRIDSTQPLCGFELFATWDGSRLGAYAQKSNANLKAGVFPKTEKNGWTGIAFVNTEDSAASVTLTAYDDSGERIVDQPLFVPAYAKVVNAADVIFSPSDITNATYITYTSDKNVVGFQLNNTWDDTMLDGLPAL
jgi:hypothetical protein